MCYIGYVIIGWNSNHWLIIVETCVIVLCVPLVELLSIVPLVEFCCCLILQEIDYDMEQSCPLVSSSPPFFSGSPPSRVANPLIQDARFGDENFSPLSPSSWVVVPAPTGLPPSPSSSSRKGGCVRANFGNKPSVRIEGFDCLDRDRRNCSIPALA